MIEIIPSIDISNGKAVKRIRGIKGTGLILGDPVQVANKIYDEGYRKIHIIDLDAAEGIGDNENYIKEICKIGFKWIQVGGGIRNYEKANRILSNGSSALIFSTLPFTNSNLFKDIVNKIGKDKILISIDYDNRGNVLIKGWKEKALKVTEAIKKVNELDLLGTILTYIPNEGTSSGIDYNVREFSSMIKGMKEYAGGVASYDDVKYLESLGFNYVIVGMSFYLNRIRGQGLTRFSNKVRETKETKVEVYIDIDRKGEVKVSTPIPFFNHMLTTLLTYMNCSAVINAIDKQSYDDHHIVEDVAIVLGKALEEALGDKRGIKRFSHFIVPMDDALILTSIDISSRGMAFINLNLKREEIGGMAIENVFHFFQSFAYNSGITVHILQLNGFNTHHIIEASFKALGMALYDATRIIDSEIRSTKGII